MQTLEVKLIHATPLKVCSDSIRMCWSSQDKSDFGGEKDKELISRVGIKLKHASTLEHVVFNFHIKNLSRACLQELARHRIASLSVKSSRYTLKELRGEDSFLPIEDITIKRASKFIVLSFNEEVNKASIQALENLRILLNNNTPNDEAKYCMPECYKTELSYSINARALNNFLSLRLDKRALQEIQNLARAMLESLPLEYKEVIFNSFNE